MFIILKSDEFFKWWSFLILAVITFLMLYLPFQFSETNLSRFFAIQVIDNLIMIIFSIDIVLNFCTAGEDSDGNKILDFKKIALN